MEIAKQFTQVIKENEGLILKVCSIYTFNADDRADLYQEIVYQLWKSFGSYKAKAKLSTWMYRVAMNTAIYFLKKEKREIRTTPLEGSFLQFAEELNKREEEKIQLLYQHIQMLSLLERGVILLYLESKSHEEIADVMGLSITNVGTRLSRIREKLKSQITKNQ
ncbi:RNA polymerase sigma factor [Peijinzhouia sedimentorum]